MSNEDLGPIIEKILDKMLTRQSEKLNRQRDLLLRLNIDRVRSLPPNSALRDAEFRVFSQAGEDGIIQFILKHCGPIPDLFIEFGVESYAEANTRLLLEACNWRGLILDRDPKLEIAIKNNDFYMRHDLTAKSATITCDNINGLISSWRTGPIGILSVDIDGNDYWIWKTIDAVDPAVVICEYNSVLGCDLPISIPYSHDFHRKKAHFSNLYFGCSIVALCHLASARGYDFVGSNSTGTNAFFVRRSLGHSLKPLTAKEGYVESRFRESRDENGALTFLNGEDRLKAIAHMPFVDVTTGLTITISG